MPEAEVVAQRGVDDFDRHGDEGPAPAADAGARAAGADFVVVGHVDVEDEFFRDGAEGGGAAEGLALAWVGGVDGANFEAGGVELDALFAEAGGLLAGVWEGRDGCADRSAVGKDW